MLLSFGQLLRFELPQSLALYPHDILLPLITGLTLWMYRHTISKNWVRWITLHRLETLTVLFFVLTAVMQWGRHNDPVQLLYLLRLVVYVAGLGAIFTLIQQRHVYTWLFWGGAALLLWFSSIMYVLFPDSRGLSFFGWDEHYYRMIGTLFDPNFTGMVLVAGTIFGIYLTLSNSSETIKKISILAIIAFSAGIGLTFSRSALVSLALTLVVMLALQFVKYRHYFSAMSKLAVLSVCCVILALLVAPKPGGEGIKLLRTVSIATRITSDSEQVTAHSYSRLLLGPLGAGQTSTEQSMLASTPAVAYHPKTANNFLVTILTWGGVAGLLLCLGLVIKWGAFLIKNHTWAAGIGIAWLINAQFNNSILEPFCFLFVGGLLLSVILIDQSKNQS